MTMHYIKEANINYIRNTGVAYADAIYSFKLKDIVDNIDFVITVGVYDENGVLFGSEFSRTVSCEEINKQGGHFIGIRIPLNKKGIINVKSTLKQGKSVVVECERLINNKTSYANASEIKLKTGSRFFESERVGLGYIMGIDLPRLVTPSYEAHGLNLLYEEKDDAVENGDKKAGDIVRRYGGWEALGAWKINSDRRYTLAGEQMGHWLSAAAVFYNALKNEKSITLTAASQNGNDTSDTTIAPKCDIVITPKVIHDKIEYVIDKLDILQNADISECCGETVHKEYIGGCDETPFLNCFAGMENWCGVYWVPWYNVHKVYQGLIDVYDYTEPELALRAYTVLKKFADWAVSGTAALKDVQMQSVLDIEYGGMNEIFTRMYEITNDITYRDAAIRFTHHSVIDPMKNNDTASLSGRHANTQIPKFVGAARLYEQDNIVYADYRTACENFWNNVNYERCYAIGGNSLSEHFQDTDTEELGVKTCESCNTYNMMRLTEHLFEWERKSEYMDWYERALYNHVLGQQEKKTGAKMYFVSMVQGTHRIYEQKYNSWWCCTGTGMENPGRYARVAYFEDGDDLYVNLYLPCIYKWNDKNLIFKTQTHYPYSENITITVSGSNNRANVRLRAPNWISGRMNVKVNGRQEAFSGGGEYIVLNSIKAGDIIDITIPMGISLYESRDNKKIVYEYGPLVLAARLDGVIKPEFEYIWEERNTACQQVVYPILKTSDGKGKQTADDMTSYITKDSGDNMLFTLAGNKNSTNRPVKLVPFADIIHNYYNIYFDLDTEIDEYGINLSNVQLDYVDPDGQQSEIGHGMIQSNDVSTEFRYQSMQGMDSNGQYRFAYGKDGFFRYDMLVDKTADKNYLILRYFDADNAVDVNGKMYGVKFKILADDNELVIDGKNCMDITEGNGSFMDKSIEIPMEIVRAGNRIDASTGYGIVSIKFIPLDDCSATVPFRRIYTATGNPEYMR